MCVCALSPLVTLQLETDDVEEGDQDVEEEEIKIETDAPEDGEGPSTS